MKNENLTLLVFPSAPKAYFLASRPKTWIASISPVLIGATMAPKVNFTVLTLTLLFSLCIQIGTNFANDYFDFIKGADARRNGPKRATQEGWVQAPAMLRASLITFTLGLIAAIPLMMVVGLWSLFLALACVTFGILYTGGPKPLGYQGLGEFLVLPFFGPTAVCGTYFLQTGSLDLSVFIAGLAPGFLSCAILIANNLRDEETDRSANKWTLVARFGKTFGKWEYTFNVVAASFVPFLYVFFCGKPIAFLSASLVLPLSIPAVQKVFSFKSPLELIAVLQATVGLLLFYTVLFILSSLW